MMLKSENTQDYKYKKRGLGYYKKMGNNYYPSTCKA